MNTHALKSSMIILLALQGMPGFSADCRDDLETSTPTSRFTANDETVRDNVTTLTWTRCAVGQTWKNGSCEGSVKSMSLAEAKAQLASINHFGYAGYHDWRLPLLPELASIVERKCFYPRANEAVFPGMPSAVFWSGMPRKGSTTLAYALDFGSGETMAMDQKREGAIRLVRGGPWWKPPTVSYQ